MKKIAVWAVPLVLFLAGLNLWLNRLPDVEIRALFLGDDGHHKPGERFAQLEPVLGRRGIELVYTNRLADLNPETLGQHDVLIIYANHEEISGEQEKALLDFVSKGGGFVPIHCASYCFLNSREYVRLVGAQFKSHESGVFVAPVIDPTHPVMQDFQEFETWDESYVHTEHNPDRRLLMVREEEGHQEPWTWVRTHGDGRVFYTAYGHDERTWSNPGFHDLIERGIRWTARYAEPEVPPADKQPIEYTEATIPYYPPGQPWGTAESRHKMALPLSPEESMKHLQVPPQFEVQLFAAEPEIVNPIAMAWDEQGRLWIAESVDYPNNKQPRWNGNDRIKICEDTDGDGRADKFTTFAEGLSIPTSLVFASGGLIVAQPPEILLLKDTDGDDREDERQILFTGFGDWDTHASASNLRWGFDNWIWGTIGYSGFTGKVGEKLHEFRQGVFRFRPDGSELEFLASTSNNTWGLGFTEEGFVFISTANNQHSVHMAIPNRYYEQVYGWSPGVLAGISDHWRFHPVKESVRQVDWHDGYTAAAGHAVYTARSYPRAYWNRVAFVAEPTGSLLHNCVLRPQGSHFVSHDAWNLVASTDEWTAPIAAEVGPDGAVWMIDWYNYIVQHNPTPHGFETGKGNAYEISLRDQKHGRIYRIAHTGGRPSSLPNLKEASTDALLRTLTHDNLLWRLTAQRLLVERGSTDVLPALIRLTENTRVDAVGLNAGAIHALCTMQGLGLLHGSSPEATSAAIQALAHSSAAVRKTALDVLPLTGAGRDSLLRSRVLGDPNPRVRLAALLALSETEPNEKLGARVFQMLRQQGNMRDRWIADGIIAAAARHKLGFLRSLSEGLPLLVAETPSGRKTLIANTSVEDISRVLRLVAMDYGREAPVDSVVPLLSSLKDISPLLLGPVLEGLALAWPKGAVPRFNNADKAELSLLMQRLSPEVRDHLLVLADHWGQRQALSADVGEVLARLRTQVNNSSLPAPDRSEAARRLVRLDEGRQSLQLILGQITPQTDLALTNGLLTSLVESSSSAVASSLIGRWNTLTPRARETAVHVLLRRPEWTLALLTAIQEGRIDHRELNAEQMQQLTMHIHDDIAEPARRLAGRTGRSFSPDREQVVERLLPLAQRRGDRERGREVFNENCQRCHSFRRQGGTIGPDLGGVANRSRADILVDILDPNRSVEGNYRLWVVTTKDGEMLFGRLESETQTTVELLDGSGERTVIPRQNIEEIRASQLSIMPDGFEEHISPRDFASLLEFLAGE